MGCVRAGGSETLVAELRKAVEGELDGLLFLAFVALVGVRDLVSFHKSKSPL
jgi:hypothetical protein